MSESARAASALRRWPFFVLLFLVSGCSSLPERWSLTDLPQARGETVELTDVAFYPQDRYQCGPASLLIMLQASGVEAEMDELIERVYVPGRRGSFQVEMTAEARRQGRLAYRLAPRPEAVVDALVAGQPVLVLQNLGLPSWPQWHYAVAVGFDAGRDAFLMHSGTEARQWQSVNRWTRRWHFADRWALVLLRPDQLPPSGEREPWLKAASEFSSSAAPEAAIIAWQTFLGRWPEEAVALLGLANAQYRLGDWAASRATLERLLALQPAHEAALHNLAWLELDNGHACRARKLLSERDAEDSDSPFADRIEVLNDRARSLCDEDSP